MCQAPITIYVGDKGDKSPVQTSCHECPQCIDQAINDWVGRNIAESKTALGASVVTLTYGRDRGGHVDHIPAALLTYSDVQKYLKLLRRHGFPVRYFVTGEYGSAKGRAHWHIMLYWQRVDPTRPVGKEGRALAAKWFGGGTAYWTDQVTRRRHSKPWKAGELPIDCDIDDVNHWPHGFSFWTSPTHDSVRYNCKYIQKGMGDAERQGHLAMSKKPPIGAVYFRELAAMYVQQGLSPQTPEYSFPDVRKQDGLPRVFWLRDRSLALFLASYVAGWRNIHGDRPYPKSDLVREFEGGGDLFQFDEDGLPVPAPERRQRVAALIAKLGAEPERKPWPKRFRWEIPGEREYLAEFIRRHAHGVEQQ